MRVKSAVVILLCLSALFPLSVSAQVRSFGNAGGYDVGGKPSSRDEKGGCIATFEYEGPGSTKTTLFRTLEGDRQDLVFLTVVNYEWSAKEKQTYKLEYAFEGGVYERDAFGVVNDSIYKGFMTAFPADEFLKIYSKSPWFHIYMGDTVVDRLSLKGSTAGVALFNRCWSWVLSTERTANAERKKFEGIPRDPFASR